MLVPLQVPILRLRVKNLFKVGTSAFMEAVEPFLSNGEVTTHMPGSFQQAETSLEFVDDAVPKVGENRKRQLPELAIRAAILA